MMPRTIRTPNPANRRGLSQGAREEPGVKSGTSESTATCAFCSSDGKCPFGFGFAGALRLVACVSAILIILTEQWAGSEFVSIICARLFLMSVHSWAGSNSHEQE